MEFSVFCIESIAEKLELTDDAVYEMLTEQSNVLNDYIISCYGVLHTQGEEYIVDNIIDVMKQKGVNVSSEEVK